jgi:hypothetical protein
MERNFNNEDFERSLKEHADQYRMYPSEKVWKGISRSLHIRRTWFGLGAILLLLSGAFVTLVMMNTSVQNKGPLTVQQPALKTNTNNSQNPVGSLTEPRGQNAAGKSSIITVNPVQSIESPAGILHETTPNTNNGIGSEDLLQKTIFNKVTPVPENKSILIVNNEFETVQAPTVLNNTDAADQDFYTNGISGTNKRIPEERKLLTYTDIYPWTIESVLNSFRKPKKKISLQLYFTPTISYRKLSENKSYQQQAPSSPYVPYTATYANFYDINKAVTHKPDIGLELGLSARYPISDMIKVKAGLQFNINRYEIKAFDYPDEMTTIALNSGGRYRDSVKAVSSYRNFSGNKADWLQNYYFQISTPVGIEVKLVGDDKIQFGLASTIQPTYMLGDRAYVITTDYKNYAEVPWLIRRWNVNTSLETFVTYSTGKLNWQVGPQVRYQLLSSFITKYPVKENLFDFGLKVGISINNQ